MVTEDCDAIIQKYMDECIVFQSTPDEWKELANLFEQRWNLPHALGAIDGKHLAEETTKVRKKKTRTVRYYDVDAATNKDDVTKGSDISKTGNEIKVFDLSNFTLEEHNAETTTTKLKRKSSKKDKLKKQKSNKMKQKEQVYDLTQIDFRKKKMSQKRLDKSLKKVQLRKESDPFPGDAPVDKNKVRKYKRGDKMDMDSIKTGYHKAKFKAKEKKYTEATRQAARTELLLHEEAGFLEADEDELTCEVSQHDIKRAVDITSAQKFFELKLDKFGPYRMNYTRNGRQLLIGGGKGHAAALDWQTKKLMCEINVMETIQDIQWLHVETMFAVAQKQWTYIYDNQGVELHCLKALDRVLRLEFLPYHFLLASANSTGYLSWLDISVGQKVAGFSTGHGRLDVMCQNPNNAIIHLGHAGGTVSLWSPNVKEPLVKMLCHAGGTRSIAVHHNGQYMATSGIDRTLKIWDLRMFKALHSTKIGVGASSLSFSQRGLLAAGLGNIVEVYRDPCRQAITSPYMSHTVKESIQNLQFCPYEDVLGVGHSAGFSSLLIPGSGEPNFDALESNPFQSKKQRQQAEVKMLLEKIQPEMINLDTSALGQVDTKTLQETMLDKEKLLYLKPQKIDFEPKYKKKGRSKTGKFEQRKKGVQYEHKRDQIREFVKQKQTEAREKTEAKNRKSGKYDVFERFKKTDV